MGLQTAPDVFLFPQVIPTVDNPEPPVHTLDTLKLPKLILDLFGIQSTALLRHVWEVHVKMVNLQDGRLRREVQVWHQGRVISASKSRVWRPED